MNAPSVLSARERSDSDHWLVMSIWVTWMVRRVRVRAANAFVCAWNGSSEIATEQVLHMLCFSSCCHRCQHESKDAEFALV